MNAFFSYLKKRRREVEDELARKGRTGEFSLSRYLLYQHLERAIELYADGVCLDAGTGHAPFKSRLRAKAARLICMDIEDRAGEVDIIGDVQNMSKVKDCSVDTVFCTQVLEHVPEPWTALSEIQRVLRKEGHVILSVPHLSSIHEAPNDYFRYTEFGLQSLLSSTGLVVCEMHRSGGLVCFLAHYATLAGMSLAAGIPGLSTIARAVNYWIMVRALEPIDRTLGMRSVFPCNYVVVAKKTS